MFWLKDSIVAYTNWYNNNNKNIGAWWRLRINDERFDSAGQYKNNRWNSNSGKLRINDERFDSDGQFKTIDEIKIPGK